MRSLKSVKGLRPASPTKFFEKYTMNEVKSLGKKELIELVQQGARVLNPRIERLEKRESSGEIATDALEYVRTTGGRFSAVSEDPDKLYKSRNELLAEYKREKEFASMRTSRVLESQAVRDEREDILRKNYKDEDLEGKSQEEINDILNEEWEKFRKFNEEHGVLYKQGKIEELYQMYMSDEEARKEKESELDASEKQKKLLEEVSKRTGYQPKIKPL